MYVDAEHIRAVIAEGNARVVHDDFSRFHDYLLELRWTTVGTRLDWSVITNHEELNWQATSNDDVYKWAKKLAIGQHSHIVFFFSPREPTLVTTFDFGIMHIDLIFWKAPGMRFIFGADYTGSELVPSYSDFLEVSDVVTLRGITCGASQDSKSEI